MRYAVLLEPVAEPGFEGFYYAHIPGLDLTTHGQGIEEILVDMDAEAGILELLIHWKGGVHTELRVRRRRRGEHGNATSTDIVDAIRALALVCTDEYIAQVLNRSGRKTGLRAQLTDR